LSSIEGVAIRLQMAPKTTLFILLATTIAGTCLQAATPENTEQEYQQVRKIALRDPKVRSAYEEADRKLQEKIVQIDPAMADYVRHRSNSGTASTASSNGSGTSTASEPGGFRKPKKAETKSASKPASSSSSTTYVIKSGDTLGAIASHYGVSVAALKAANHIVDEKKLAVGQELRIPAK
jgi:LysM repeat protein